MKHGYRVLIGVLVVVALTSALTLMVPLGQDSLAQGDIIYVDADATTGNNDGSSWVDAHTTLQSALNAAGIGDEIRVAEGTYTPTAEHGGTGDRYKSFQMKNGVAIYGGFDPSVGDEAWEDRDWEVHPAILSGDIGIKGADFDNSYHVFYHPVGTNLDGSAILDGFIITGGKANGPEPHFYGGGIYNGTGSSPALTNCTFSNNSAGTWGGGLYSFGSSPTLTNCSFARNSADLMGGGIYIFNSSPMLVNCTFTGNSANFGGGMANDVGSSPILTNCTFSGNSAYSRGGGMYNFDSSAALTNCTFSGNLADSGGGIGNDVGSSPKLTNCIMWGDSPPEISNYDSASSPTVTYSNIQGGHDGAGNIDAEPQFVDPDSGDFHLGASSPCIDVGDNDAADLLEVDFEGDDRILDGNGDGSAFVDMGVDEVARKHYVDADATGSSDGSTWQNAFTELQPAQDAAVVGDEIWVAAGVYTPTVEHGGTGDRYRSFQLMNGVALYGGFDPSVGALTFEERDWILHETILNGDLNGDDGPDFANNDENSYHVFIHPEGMALDSTAVLDGFTITGGNADGDDPHDKGGGMHNDRSSPALVNCTFSGNSASFWGGGLYNYSSSPSLANCTFAGNSSSFDGGGMSNIGGSLPSLTNCMFQDNSAAYEGGGMFNSGSSPSLTDCTFQDNSAASEGGGMYNGYFSSPSLINCAFAGNSSGSGGGMYNAWSSSPSLTNCNFTGNSAVHNGGGLYNWNGSSPRLTNCTFSNNSADTWGGGMFNNQDSSPWLTASSFTGNWAVNGGGICNESSSPLLTNCTFGSNSADVFGGGMYNTNSSPILTNCTFTDNSAECGGGIHNAAASLPTLTNCILWGDAPDEICDDLSMSMVTYSDVMGSYPGEGNIDTNPLFVDAGGDDLRLEATSPCIDAGDNSTPGLVGMITDRDGNPRFVDVLAVPDTGNGDPPIVDMGAYEALPGVILVDQAASGTNDGSSWDNAFTDLQPALEAAGAGDQIWVAEGTYTPTYLSTLDDQRSTTFQMKNGVAIYGGFDPSVGDVAFEDRDCVNHETILSGDLNGDDGPGFVSNNENSYHVFYHPESTHLDSTAILDGFVIYGGNANGDEFPHYHGGGMYNYHSSPTLASCIFSGNSTELFGGGMYNFQSSPVVTSCSFRGNRGSFGGGMSNTSSSPVLTGCTFSANSASNGGGLYNGGSSSPVITSSIFAGNSAAGGGGMLNDGSSPMLTNCTFALNSANSGGGMSNGYSSPTLTNCSFWANSSYYDGGGMFNEGSSPVLTNCTFSANSTRYQGGGMANDYSSEPTLTNCILWGDTSPEIANLDESSPAVTHSDVQGGYDGLGNINAAPLFVDLDHGDLHLGTGSPCIDTGDNDAPNLPYFDFDGDDRVLDGNGDGTQIVDMGVDEAFWHPSIYLPLVLRNH